MEGSRVGATPISHSAALPHIRLPVIQKAEMVLVRSLKPCFVKALNYSDNTSIQTPINAFFFFMLSL